MQVVKDRAYLFPEVTHRDGGEETDVESADALGDLIQPVLVAHLEEVVEEEADEEANDEESEGDTTGRLEPLKGFVGKLQE